MEFSSRAMPDISESSVQHDQALPGLTTLRLVDSLPDVAIHRWVTKYVRGSHLEFITSYWQASALKEPLRSAVTAVALASFASEMPSGRLWGVALQHYDRATCQTQKAIQDPVRAQSDDALAAVLLHSSFETVSADLPFCAKNWTSHVRGAHALASARGTALLETPFGRQMFMQVVGSVTLDCIQSHTRLPEPLQNMMKSMPDSYLSNPRRSLQRIVEGLIDLRASVAEGEIISASDIAYHATHLDIKARVLEADMHRQLDYDYSLVQSQARGIGGSVQHVYPSTNAFLAWNSVRMLRILFNDILVSQLPGSEVQVDGSAAALQRDECRTTVSKICHDICASIPQVPDLKDDVFDHVAAVNFSIWPLFKAASADLASVAVRCRALDKLAELGHRHGIHRAFLAAEQLKRRDYSDMWIHVHHMF